MSIDKTGVIFERLSNTLRKIRVRKPKWGGPWFVEKAEWKTISSYRDGEYIVLLQRKFTQQEVG